MNTETKQGGRKTPRTTPANERRVHNPEWKDNTRNARQTDRNKKLNEAAQAAGWDNWSEYATAAMKGEIKIQEKPR